MSPPTWNQNGLRKASILTLVVGLLCTSWMLLGSDRKPSKTANSPGLSPDISFPHQFAVGEPRHLPSLTQQKTVADLEAFDQSNTVYLQPEDSQSNIELVSTTGQPNTWIEKLPPTAHSNAAATTASQRSTNFSSTPDSGSAGFNTEPNDLHRDLALAASKQTESQSSSKLETKAPKSIPALQIKRLATPRVFGLPETNENPTVVQNLPELALESASEPILASAIDQLPEKSPEQSLEQQDQSVANHGEPSREDFGQPYPDQVNREFVADAIVEAQSGVDAGTNIESNVQNHVKDHTPDTANMASTSSDLSLTDPVNSQATTLTINSFPPATTLPAASLPFSAPTTTVVDSSSPQTPQLEIPSAAPSSIESLAAESIDNSAQVLETTPQSSTTPVLREPYPVDPDSAAVSGNGLVQQAPVPHSNTSDSQELIDWWNYRIADPNRANAQVRTVSLADLIASAIEHSPRIRTLQRVPQITGTQVQLARSDFDPIISLNNKYTDTMDPVGNTLTTGGAPFLQDNIWDSIGRVSKKLEGGSEVSFYQKLGFKNSNSNFFAPQDQGTATLGMDLRIPLLKGAGTEFNQTPIVVAELETDVAWDQYQVELQKEIADIGTLYWNLQTTRALYLQQQRSVQRAERVLRKLEARLDYDASISQVAQAKAELSLRINELQSSLQAMVELEITVRERIGDPDLEFVPNVEMIPNQIAAEVFDQQEPQLNELLATALTNRLELHAEDSKIQIAERQVFRSRCGLAPKLDMVFNVYSSSLKGDSGVERAYQEQFSNAPGFSGALEYEIPYGRRSAKATVQQAELQRQQAADLKQIQRNEIIADVQKAYTRWISARASYMTAKQTVVDMRRSVEQLQLRWEEFAFIEGPVSQGATPSLALDQLLAGQRRLADTEARLANAELAFALAQQGLLTATGSLFSADFETNEILSGPTLNQ